MIQSCGLSAFSPLRLSLLKRLKLCSRPIAKAITRSQHGQVEEPHRAQPEPQGAPEPHPQAFEQEAVQDEGDGPQVSEEPQVLQEAQPEHRPAAQEGEAERGQQIVLLRSRAGFRVVVRKIQNEALMPIKLTPTVIYCSCTFM